MHQLVNNDHEQEHYLLFLSEISARQNAAQTLKWSVPAEVTTVQNTR